MPIVTRSQRGAILLQEHLQGASPATAANYGTIFVCDRSYVVKQVRAVHGTASSSGTLQLEKLTGTQAKGAGASMLASTISTAGTANTVNTGTLTATVANLKLVKGDRIGMVNGGTLTSSADLYVDVVLFPVGPK